MSPHEVPATSATTPAVISLSQARQLARAEVAYLNSSTSVTQLTRADRLKRLQLAQNILEALDDRPHDATLTPKQWLFVRQLHEEAGSPAFDASLDDEDF